MAERRMFAKTIIDSDAFLDMPASSQLLYFHLGMRADDDGFVNNPKKIARMTGASDDDIKLLVAKKFIIPFESGVVVIKHWRLHNYIRKDTYTETTYKEEKAMLGIDENKSYTTSRPRAVHEPSTQVSIGKVSIGKVTEVAADTIKHDFEIRELSRSNQLDVSVFTYYEQNISPLTPIIGEKLKALIDEVGEIKVKSAIQEAATHNARSYAYIEAVARGNGKPKQETETYEEKKARIIAKYEKEEAERRKKWTEE